MSRTARALFAFVVIMVCWRPGFAQNLIVNPTFDAGLHGWSVSGGTWTIVVEGSDPCVRVEEAVGAGADLSQCIPAAGEHLFLYQTRARFDSGSSGDVAYRLTFYPEADCGGGVSSGPHILVPDLDSQWLVSRASIRAAAGSQSARVSFGPLPGSVGVFYFDDLRAVMSLFDDGFESGQPESWSRVIP